MRQEWVIVNLNLNYRMHGVRSNNSIAESKKVKMTKTTVIYQKDACVKVEMDNDKILVRKYHASSYIKW